MGNETVLAVIMMNNVLFDLHQYIKTDSGMLVMSAFHGELDIVCDALLEEEKDMVLLLLSLKKLIS